MRLGPRATMFRPADVGYSSHGKLKANYTDYLLKTTIEEQMEYLLLKKVRRELSIPRKKGKLNL